MMEAEHSRWSRLTDSLPCARWYRWSGAGGAGVLPVLAWCLRCAGCVCLLVSSSHSREPVRQESCEASCLLHYFQAPRQTVSAHCNPSISPKNSFIQGNSSFSLKLLRIEVKPSQPGTQGSMCIICLYCCCTVCSLAARPCRELQAFPTAVMTARLVCCRGLWPAVTSEQLCDF